MLECGTPARAYRNAAQNGLAAGNNKINLDTRSFDDEGFFDVTTNHRYIAGEAGSFLVCANVSVTGQAAVIPAVLLIVQKSGSDAFYGNWSQGSAVAQTIGSSGSDVVEMDAGDYLELWLSNGSGGLVDLQAPTPRRNYLTVIRLA